MKGFWNYLGPSFKESQKPLKRILKATSLAAYNDRVEAFFERPLEFLSQPPGWYWARTIIAKPYKYFNPQF
jgi:hypothetical protein